MFDDDGQYYIHLEWAIKVHNEQAWNNDYYNPLNPEQNPYPF